MAAPVNTVLPAISGTLALGATLTTTDGTWTGGVSYAVQWLRNGVSISGATAHTYVLVRDDLGAVIKARITATGATPLVDGTTDADSLGTTPLTTTLIAEDGTGTLVSESYCTVAFADDYHSKLGNDSWATASLNDKEGALRKATEFMTQRYRQRWLGFRYLLTQALDWPRYNVPIPDTSGGYRGYPAMYSYTIVPDQVKKACAQLALRVVDGTILNPDIAPAVKQKTVGPITVIYERGSTAATAFVEVDELLSSLLKSTSSVRVMRA